MHLSCFMKEVVVNHSFVLLTRSRAQKTSVSSYIREFVTTLIMIRIASLSDGQKC